MLTLFPLPEDKLCILVWLTFGFARFDFFLLLLGTPYAPVAAPLFFGVVTLVPLSVSVYALSFFLRALKFFIRRLGVAALEPAGRE